MLEKITDHVLLRLAGLPDVCFLLSVLVFVFGYLAYLERRRANRVSDAHFEMMTALIGEMREDAQQMRGSLARHAKAARRVGQTFAARANSLEQTEHWPDGA